MSSKKQKKVIPIVDDLDDGRTISSLTDSRYIQILIGLISFSFVLRFYYLGFNSLWLDEATTNMISMKSFGDIWQIVVSGEFNPPLFYWMEHIMISLFGNSEIVLRFLPALFGACTIPIMYYIGKEFINKNVGIILASAFTFSPFLIYYSQEARAYSAMLFFIACAALFYMRSLRENNVKDWVLFGVLSAISFWLHFYAVVMVVTLIVYAIIAHIKDIRTDISNIKPLLVSILVFVGITLPLIIVTIDLFGKRTAGSPTYGIQGFGIIWDTFVQMSVYSELLMVLFLSLFVIGLISVSKPKAKFLLWSIISIFIVSYFLSFKIPMLSRYLLFLTIPFFIGIAMSYKTLFLLFPTKKIVYGMVVLFFLVSVPFYMNYYSQPTKSDWRGFSDSLEKLTKSGDYVVFVPGYLQTPTEYYYQNSTDGVIFISAYTAKDLDNIQKNNNSIFYVMTGDAISADPSGGSTRWLINNAKQVTQYNDIFLFVR